MCAFKPTNPSLLPLVIALAAACGSPDSASEEPPISQVDDSRKSALLLVQRDSRLSAGEAALQDRLMGSGYEVTLSSAAGRWIEEEHHVDLILVGPEAGQSECALLRLSNRPMLVMNSECMDELQMARTLDSAEGNEETDLRLLSEHALAAGLAGQLRISSEPSPALSISLGEGALRIATRTDDPSTTAIFAYERDEKMVAIDAPARRAGWLVGSADHFTLDGWQLFDATVQWAAQPRALLLMDGQEPTANERILLERLRDPLGFQIETISLEGDHKAIVRSAERSRLVLLSHSAAAPPIANELRDLRVPILSLDASALGPLRMLPEGQEQESGTMQVQQSLFFPEGEHVLRATEARSLAIATEPVSVGWALPSDEAIVVASIDGSPKRGAIFGLERGTDLAIDTIPARRFAFLLGPNAAPRFNAETWRLFDLAVRWSARISTPQTVCLGRPDGASCADDDPCNGIETCQSEGCVAVPMESDDPMFASCAQEENPVLELSDSSVELLATHTCLPNTQPTFEGAEVESASDVEFFLPPTLPVRLGNAGSATATLSFLSDDGGTTTCEYRGASPLAHPITDIDIAKGRHYQFQGCDDGSTLGTKLRSARFALNLEGSDCESAPSKTEVEIQLGVGGCSAKLPDPISAVDSMITRDNFQWSDTKPVAEYDSEGRPSLYHGLIYIEDREQRSFLDDLLIHHSLLPIFNSQRSRYAGQCGSIEFEGDGQGLFVFAILPGVTYNLLREYALKPKFESGDQEVFRVVKLTRPQDPGVTNQDGSLSYEALGSAGFRYMQLDTLPESSVPSMFVSGVLRDVINNVAEVGGDIVRGAMVGLGRASDYLGVDYVPFYLDLRVLNRDPLFEPNETLVSGWNEGKEITLPGVRVEVHQYVGGVIPVMSYSHTNEEGQVSDLRVAKGRTVQSICIATQNQAAEITSYVTETMVCGYAGSGYSGLGQVDIKKKAGSDPFVPLLGPLKPGALTFLTIDSHNRFLHTLALITDSYQYAKTVIGKTPDSIEVLKGATANLIGSVNGGAAFVPCFGHSTTSLDAAIAALAAALTLVAGPAAGGVTATLLYGVASAIAVDMILPASGEGDAFHSRGIAVHEYGHVVFCDLLYKADEGDVYTDMMISRIESGAAGTPDAHMAYVNEAFADFFFGQVAGAVNYFRPTELSNTEFDGTLWWCVDNTPISTDPDSACFDVNHSAKTSFDAQVGRIASTLHDGFDGNHLGHRAERPNDAAMWVKNTNDKLVYTDDFQGHSSDEAVAMHGSCIATVIENFAKRSDGMRGDLRFLAGLSDAMKDPSCNEFAPPTWCQRCDLFSNHDGFTPQDNIQDKYAACTSGELATIVGPAPINDVNKLAASCQVCPTNYISPDGVTCVFDPPIDCPPSAPVAVYDGIEQMWTCQSTCGPGFVFVNGSCQSTAIID